MDMDLKQLMQSYRKMNRESGKMDMDLKQIMHSYRKINRDFLCKRDKSITSYFCSKMDMTSLNVYKVVRWTKVEVHSMH